MGTEPIYQGSTLMAPNSSSSFAVVVIGGMGSSGRLVSGFGLGHHSRAHQVFLSGSLEHGISSYGDRAAAGSQRVFRKGRTDGGDASINRNRLTAVVIGLLALAVVARTCALSVLLMRRMLRALRL